MLIRRDYLLLIELDRDSVLIPHLSTNFSQKKKTQYRPSFFFPHKAISKAVLQSLWKKKGGETKMKVEVEVKFLPLKIEG